MSPERFADCVMTAAEVSHRVGLTKGVMAGIAFTVLATGAIIKYQENARRTRDETPVATSSYQSCDDPFDALL